MESSNEGLTENLHSNFQKEYKEATRSVKFKKLIELEVLRFKKNSESFHLHCAKERKVHAVKASVYHGRFPEVKHF